MVENAATPKDAREMGWCPAALVIPAVCRVSGTDSIAEHYVGDAVAVARLIGVPAAVHVGEVEPADGAQ